MRCKRSSVTPPEASVGTRPATCRTAAASSRSARLSSSKRSAPAASASSICSFVLTSASTRRNGEAAAFARRTASPIPPEAAAWLSFTRIPSNSALRWFVPPPARTADFSSSRIPGVVLRVSSRRVRVPCSVCAYRRVSVATPHNRCSRFSAVRSPLRIARSKPRTRRTPAPASAAAPSPRSASRSHRGSSARKTRAAAETPETTSDSFATKSAVPRASAPTQASAVRWPWPTSSSRASSMSLPTASRGRPKSSAATGFAKGRDSEDDGAVPRDGGAGLRGDGGAFRRVPRGSPRRPGVDLAISEGSGERRIRVARRCLARAAPRALGAAGSAPRRPPPRRSGFAAAALCRGAALPAAPGAAQPRPAIALPRRAARLLLAAAHGPLAGALRGCLPPGLAAPADLAGTVRLVPAAPHRPAAQVSLARLAARHLRRLLPGEPLLDLGSGLRHLVELLFRRLQTRLHDVGRLLHQAPRKALHPRCGLRCHSFALAR